MLEKIQEAYQSSKTYPEIVIKLIALGINNYTVDTATGSVIYRRANGENIHHPGKEILRNIQTNFNAEAVKTAILDNQQGKTDYPGFMKAIADAGVRFYESTLDGNNKRVTYYGVDGFHEERIPL